MSLHTLVLLVAGALLFGPFNHISAQSSRGTVTGLVVDSTKAVISNATVDLNNEDTKVARSTNTNESGIYRFDAVDPGNYTLKITAPGFKTLAMAPFVVAATQVKSLDGQLELGSVSNTVEVSSEAALIQTEAPVRGGTLSSQNLVNLPVANQNPVSLVLTLPGVSTNRYATGIGTFSVNGARSRSNNFLIDGTENNDISVAGQAFQITNPDAVQEVAAQTSNFDSEYGRAGGAVVNIITKSGTNEFHGTLRYLLDSTFDDALTNLQKLDPKQLQRGHPAPGTDQFFSGTVGGPVVKNKLFFFSSYQEERQVSTSTVQLNTPSAVGRAALLAAFPNNPRAALLNQITAGADATAQLTNVFAGPNNTIPVQTGTFTQSYANKFRDRQLLERVDYSISNNDQLSVRYLYDSTNAPTGGTGGTFAGFVTSFQNEVNEALLTETHTFSPVMTNELRLAYNRIYYFFPFDATSPLAATTPQTTIAGISAGNLVLGVANNLPQGRIANNYQIQDTLNYVAGKHSFRMGTDLLDQRSKQAAPFNSRGTLNYQASTIGGNNSGLANFLADYGGSGGSASRDFGSASYYPVLFRQAYFMQDRWRTTENLTLSLGVRYEFFGVPINTLRGPAYTGLFNVNPVTFGGPYTGPNHVNSDLNNWSPSVGIAYSPSKSGPFGLFGDKKTVFRAGFNMGYDSFFNNIASNAVASAPNNISTVSNSVASSSLPRGLANLSGALPTTAAPFTATLTQNLVLNNLVNPYYMHWSGGFQRELPGKFVVDASYVGTRGIRLFVTEDLNPLVPSSLQHFPAGYSAANLPANRLSGRYDPLQGARTIRTNGGGSKYHAGQLSVRRTFANNFNFQLSYTRSKFLDNGSDIFTQTGNNLQQSSAVPSIFGGLTNDWGISGFDRPNRVALTGIYELPFMRGQQGALGRVVGGWQLSGVYVMESGAPINITNGFDADGIGGNLDRPQYNPNGVPNSRAVPNTTSATGYINPDTNQPISPASAMYIALPSCASTVTPCPTGNLGRDTTRTPIQNNFDATIQKSIRVSERMRFEFRAEFYNLFNHRQYGIASISPFDGGTTTIGANVATTTANRFLNPIYADGGARVMRYQLKFVF